MNILCRIGLHRWREIGFTSLVMPAGVDQCARCERGRVREWFCTVHYTAEQMREAKARMHKESTR
jgi:hypothetical protein